MVGQPDPRYGGDGRDQDRLQIVIPFSGDGCSAASIERICAAALRRMFGWQMHVVDYVDRSDRSTRMNTIQNWPCQAHGAAMLQIAAIALVEAGVKVCFPLHDAFLIEAPKRDIADVARFTQMTMERAGEAILASRSAPRSTPSPIAGTRMTASARRKCGCTSTACCAGSRTSSGSPGGRHDAKASPDRRRQEAKHLCRP